MSKIHNRIILLCISFPVGLPELHNFSAGSSALPQSVLYIHDPIRYNKSSRYLEENAGKPLNLPHTGHPLTSHQ